MTYRLICDSCTDLPSELGADPHVKKVPLTIQIGPETVVQLDNREENIDFLLRYEIYDTGTGELVFETDLIPSGQHIDWVPGETLEPGEYTLNFLQIPYYPDPSGEYVALTQGSNQVNLAILD